MFFLQRLCVFFFAEAMCVIILFYYSAHSIDIRAVCLYCGSYGNPIHRFRVAVVGIYESRDD